MAYCLYNKCDIVDIKQCGTDALCSCFLTKTDVQPWRDDFGLREVQALKRITGLSESELAQGGYFDTAKSQHRTAPG